MLHYNGDRKHAGAVRTYDLINGTEWKLVNELLGKYKHDEFGASDSISGDGKRLAVGAHGYDIDTEKNK